MIPYPDDRPKASAWCHLLVRNPQSTKRYGNAPAASARNSLQFCRLCCNSPWHLLFHFDLHHPRMTSAIWTSTNVKSLHVYLRTSLGCRIEGILALLGDNCPQTWKLIFYVVLSHQGFLSELVWSRWNLQTVFTLHGVSLKRPWRTNTLQCLCVLRRTWIWIHRGDAWKWLSFVTWEQPCSSPPSCMFLPLLTFFFPGAVISLPVLSDLNPAALWPWFHLAWAFPEPPDTPASGLKASRKSWNSHQGTPSNFGESATLRLQSSQHPDWAGVLSLVGVKPNPMAFIDFYWFLLTLHAADLALLWLPRGT